MNRQLCPSQNYFKNILESLTVHMYSICIPTLYIISWSSTVMNIYTCNTDLLISHLLVNLVNWPIKISGYPKTWEESGSIQLFIDKSGNNLIFEGNPWAGWSTTAWGTGDWVGLFLDHVLPMMASCHKRYMLSLVYKYPAMSWCTEERWIVPTVSIQLLWLTWYYMGNLTWTCRLPIKGKSTGSYNCQCPTAYTYLLFAHLLPCSPAGVKKNKPRIALWYNMKGVLPIPL